MNREQPIFYFPSQARHFGSVSKAVIYNQIVYWTQHNKIKKRNNHDDRYWCYMTYKEMSKMTGLSQSQIKRLIKDLTDGGYIIVGDYNKMWSDRTKWYSPLDHIGIMEGTESSIRITDDYTDSVNMTPSHSVNMSPSQQVNMTPPIPIKTKEQENQLGVDEGGTPLERVSPTSSSPKKEKKGGWEKFVDMYPSSKQRDIIEAASVWNGLSQRDKQAVFRHSKVYIENTEPQFIKQIGKYLQSDLWRNMKPKMTNTQRYESAGYEVVDCLNENTYSTKKNSILDLMREQGLND